MLKLATVGLITYYADENGNLYGTCNFADRFFFPTNARDISVEITKRRARLSVAEKKLLREYDIDI